MILIYALIVVTLAALITSYLEAKRTKYFKDFMWNFSTYVLLYLFIGALLSILAYHLLKISEML